MRIIKQLRRKKGIKQSKLAEVIGVSSRTIQLYERQNANIPIKNLTKISEYFEVSIAEMYLKEFNDFRVPLTVKKESFAKHGSVFYPLNYGRYLAMVPLLLMEDYEKYLETIGSNTPNTSSFQIGFVVDIVEDKKYNAFEISGDAMNDGTIHSIPNKTIVLGVQFDKTIFTTVEAEKKAWRQYYVLICHNRIMCKQVIGYDKNQKTIRCHNLNPSPEYQDFELPLKDVIQVFRIAKKQF